MSTLNEDILYLIFFKELQDDKNTLYSCLLVNKTWCEIIIPILWKNPWKKRNEKILFNIIFSYLSDELKNNLCQKIDFLTDSYKKPLFDYISFCRHLNFVEIERIIDMYIILEERRLSIKNDIINVFINDKTRFTHLYIPQNFNYQIHLIPGAEFCFSRLEFLFCKTSVNEKVLGGLTKICKSIKELEIFIENCNNNYEIIKLIENQRNLYNISFTNENTDESFCKILEKSLIKHENNIQYFKMTKPLITNVLSSFVNLKILELVSKFKSRNIKWNCLENISLPCLQILRAYYIPIYVLTNLINNSSGSLIEINIDYISHSQNSNKRIIQAIYQNCPNLMYLKILLKNNSNLELENLLINCPRLDGLYLIISNFIIKFNWVSLFTILAKLSPNCLFKFKFSYYYREIDSKSLKLFFNNWKGRNPMLLQIIPRTHLPNLEMSSLIDKYIADGIVKKYDYNINYKHTTFKDFEWI
ncbi:unnamed protein product [Rhizophagus irregularis]|nr:unnamed protein product [Rhizophagus irregularis]